MKSLQLANRADLLLKHAELRFVAEVVGAVLKDIRDGDRVIAIMDRPLKLLIYFRMRR